MAPALIEAAATVSQSSAKNFDFIQRHLLENLANNFARRHRISTIPTERTLETSSGRSITHVENTVIKSQITGIESCGRNSDDIDKMNAAEVQDQHRSSDQEILANEKERFDQSSERTKLSNAETCALSEAEGGKSAVSGSNSLQKSAPCVSLKERTKNNDSKLQALERRARNLKQRVREFQTGRLLSHVKTQAQLLDYSQKASRDLRTKPDQKVNSSLQLNQESSKNVLAKSRTSDAIASVPTSSSKTLPSVLKSDSKLVEKLGQKAQSPNLGPNHDIVHDESHLRKISQNKQEVFGILTNSVKSIVNLDDPDATDPESEDDDVADIVLPTSTEARSFNKV